MFGDELADRGNIGVLADEAGQLGASWSSGSPLAVRVASGDEPSLGYRINSTSFWPNDLATEDITGIVADLDKQLDIDYVSVLAGVHHAFIHTLCTSSPGW
jgi:hypothetical protein